MERIPNITDCRFLPIKSHPTNYTVENIPKAYITNVGVSTRCENVVPQLFACERPPETASVLCSYQRICRKLKLKTSSRSERNRLFPLLQCTSIVWRMPNLLIITTCLGDEIPNVDAFVRIIKNKNDVKKNLRFVEKTIVDCSLFFFSLGFDTFVYGPNIVYIYNI